MTNKETSVKSEKINKPKKAVAKKDAVKKEIIDNKVLFSDKLFELEILRTDDSPEEVTYFTSMFYDLLTLFTQPFQSETFDFSAYTGIREEFRYYSVQIKSNIL
jgi:hypothetical protein